MDDVGKKLGSKKRGRKMGEGGGGGVKAMSIFVI